MRVIVINRKRLGVTVIIIGLMLVLFGLEKKFDGRLKYVALMQSNINTLVKYDVPELKFSYKLPEMWTAKRTDFGGDEILYHNDFSSDDSVIHGFVQVWSLKQDLKSFLENSKKINEVYAQYSDYNMTPLVVKKHEGYLVTYNIRSSTDGIFKGYEYFLKDTDKYFRFAFFVGNTNFKENMPTIFKTIVDTFDSQQ